jgi:hypothetical protein
MIINFLNNIDLSPANCFESLGQILDSMVQVLEEVEKEITENPSVTKSFGELESFLRKNHILALADNLSEIRLHRKKINIRAPEPEKVAQLRDMVIGLIKNTKFSDIEHVYRIRYLPVLENSAGIESPVGFSRFNLYHGSISHIKCNTLVISASSEEGLLDGQVVNALKWRYGIKENSDYSLFADDAIKIVYYDMKNVDSLFDHLVVLAVDTNLKVVKSSLQKQFCFQLFACLNQLEYLGVNLTDIGLSFLFGNRTDDKEQSVQTLIFESLMWLKQAKNTKSIHCSLLHKEELDLWNSTMNSTLSRSSIDPKANPMIDALKMELVNLLDQHKTGSLKDGVAPLYSALSTKDGLNIDLVCTFSRTLCELIVRDVSKQHNLKASGDLLSSIERLRTEGVISPWISSYMHGIRVLGNKSVHPPKKPPKYKPDKLELGDLASALMGIRSLLEFWRENING